MNKDLEPEANAERQKQDDVITLVLTADNHLGYTGFGQQPRKRAEHQQRLRHAFQQATDFAIAQGVDLFIQAGDLFDTPAPDELDRSFIASRLAQLKQAGIQSFALGGLHDTPTGQTTTTPAPQESYESLGALRYFPPRLPADGEQLEPTILDIRGVSVGLCGVGVTAGQEGDPLVDVERRTSLEIERVAIPILVLHAPIEGLVSGSSPLSSRALVSRESIQQQPYFHYILAGYHHNYSSFHVGQVDVVVAGATQYIGFNSVDFASSEHAPGFVFLGLAADGVRWCNHISVETLSMQRLVIQTSDLWSDDATLSPTESILERLRPLCHDDSMVQLCLEGELTRGAYHQLDLNQIRRYGEEHCFALAIDDSALSLLPDQHEDVSSSGADERLSLREEVAALADELITAATDDHEQQALRFTKENLLATLDELKNS